MQHFSLTGADHAVVDQMCPNFVSDHFPGAMNRVPYSHADIIRQPNQSPLRPSNALVRMEGPNGKRNFLFFFKSGNTLFVSFCHCLIV